MLVQSLVLLPLLPFTNFVDSIFIKKESDGKTLKVHFNLDKTSEYHFGKDVHYLTPRRSTVERGFGRKDAIDLPLFPKAQGCRKKEAPQLRQLFKFSSFGFPPLIRTDATFDWRAGDLIFESAR